jgi:hypothetical protein
LGYENRGHRHRLSAWGKGGDRGDEGMKGKKGGEKGKRGKGGLMDQEKEIK